MTAAQLQDEPAVPRAEPKPLVSILINNYNYAQYLPAAIDSAIAQDYPSVEVIVVDDGSTDESAQILDRYAARVRVIRQANAGQPAAGRTGFDASTGEIVMFLDADDFLYPQAVSRVVAAWQAGCGKVQFRLALVGADGVAFGTDPPWTVAMPNGDLIPQLQRTGYYETPVTSGNAYPREVLAELFPFPPQFNALDHFLNAITPLYGPVISIDEELGAYRQHDRNRWAFSGGVDVDRLRQRVRYDLIKHSQLRLTAAERGIHLPANLLLKQPDHVLHRLASLRLDPATHPQREDHRLWLLHKGLLAINRHSALPAADRVVQTVILLAVAVLPRRAAAATVAWAVGGGRRPEWLRRIAGLLRGTRRKGSP